MDSKIRDSVLKINTILKKNPTSLKQLAKNLIHSQPQLPSHPPHQSQKRLFDYGDFAPPSSNHRYGRPARDTLHKSVENLSAQEGEYQDYGSVKPLLPQRQIPRQPIVHQSLETLKPDEETRNRFFVDWATTPIYDEYRDTGTREYNYTRHQAFYWEHEIPKLYKLIKERYSNVSSYKAIEPFYHKAMDTLGEVLGSFSLNHVLRAIQKIYTQADVQNTLKLLLRVQSLFQARYTLFQIFEDILLFKVRHFANS